MFFTPIPTLSDDPLGSDASGPGKLGVLIVDDEPVLAEEIAEYLQLDGYRTSVAHDGQTALDIFRRVPAGSFAVVLTDLRMPGMNGFALAEAILQEASDGLRTEVIVLTGHGSAVAKAETPEGLYAMLSKPIRLSELAELTGLAHDAALARRRVAGAPVVSIRDPSSA